LKDDGSLPCAQNKLPLSIPKWMGQSLHPTVAFIYYSLYGRDTCGSGNEHSRFIKYGEILD